MLHLRRYGAILLGEQSEKFHALKVRLAERYRLLLRPVLD